MVETCAIVPPCRQPAFWSLTALQFDNLPEQILEFASYQCVFYADPCNNDPVTLKIFITLVDLRCESEKRSCLINNSPPIFFLFIFMCCLPQFELITSNTLPAVNRCTCSRD